MIETYDLNIKKVLIILTILLFAICFSMYILYALNFKTTQKFVEIYNLQNFTQSEISYITDISKSKVSKIIKIV